MHIEALDKKVADLFPLLSNFPDFYLAGGTALALQIGHRISVDLDLFSRKLIPKTLLKKVQKIFAKKKITHLVNNSDELSLLINGGKVTFLFYPFALLKKLANFQGVKLLSVPEIAASKAYTIGRRGSLRDYVDLFSILRGKYASLKEIMALAIKKYGSAFNSRLFLEQLIYLDDLEATNIIFLKRKTTKKEMLSFFKHQIQKNAFS